MNVVLDERVVDEYCNKLPLEMRLPAMALKDDKHWAVFLYLVENGETRFGEIGGSFRIESNNDIDPILKRLVEGGIVKKYVKTCGQLVDKRATWYNITDIGREYLESLIMIITPSVLTNEYLPINSGGNKIDDFISDGFKFPEYSSAVFETEYLIKA